MRDVPADERLIRLARLPDEVLPVPIYSGEPPAPIPCKWVGVYYVAGERPGGRETFVLMFIDDRGAPWEELQFDSLEIAIDQAHAICGCPRTMWIDCAVSSLEDGTFHAAELRRVAP